MTVTKKSKSKFDLRAFLAKADGGVTVSTYSKGQVVFTQGEPADSVFYIQEGKIKISVVSAQGKEAVIAFLEAGDFIGEGCLTGRPRRISAARALTDCILLEWISPQWCGCSAPNQISPNYSQRIFCLALCGWKRT